MKRFIKMYHNMKESDNTMFKFIFDNSTMSTITQCLVSKNVSYICNELSITRKVFYDKNVVLKKVSHKEEYKNVHIIRTFKENIFLY